MRKVVMLVLLAVFVSASAFAVGLNMYGESGGYLVPDANIGKSLAVAATYTNLDETADNRVSVTGGLMNRLEVGLTRASQGATDSDIYHGKLGFSFKKDWLKTAFALGAIGTDVESLSALNSVDLYLVGQFTVIETNQGFDIALVLRSTDQSGEREYLGEALVGLEVTDGWLIYGEFKQQPSSVNNQWSAFLCRQAGSAVVKAGSADVGAGKLGDQFFMNVSANI